MTAVEAYVQARGNPTSETTGNGVFALFEHNTARPVTGPTGLYAAPQRHTHAVWMNQTMDASGKVRSVQSLEMLRSQELGTLIYRTELARGLTEAGYQWTVGDHNEPKISGFTEDYMVAISPRHEQIVEALHLAHRTGARAAQLAALATREAKVQFDHDTMQEQHRIVSAAFGNQPQAVVAAALARGHQQLQDPVLIAKMAATFAKDQQMEREAVVDERKLKTAMALCAAVTRPGAIAAPGGGTGAAHRHGRAPRAHGAARLARPRLHDAGDGRARAEDPRAHA